MSEDISEQDLEKVVQDRYDQDHFLTGVTERTDLIGRSFPPGTRCFIVEHESRTCPHEFPCHWFGWVYAYQGRFVLIKDMEAPFVTLAEVVERITRVQQN